MARQAFTYTEGPVRKVAGVTYDFRDHVVLITGAARGQGRSHALAFAEAGAAVALCDAPAGLDTASYPLGDEEALERTAEECRALGAEVLTQSYDVRDSDSAAAFVEDTVAELGALDVVIANAGIGSIVEAVDMAEREWDDMIDTNLKGVFLTFQHAARRLIALGRGGSLIATGSVNCFAGVPGCVHYVAAKHGLSGLCKALAIELAPHAIRVNYVCPTAVNTPMVAIVNDPRVPETHGQRLLDTSGSWNLLQEGSPPLEPGEITQAVLWLASDASLYVTGSPILVDAGFMTK